MTQELLGRVHRELLDVLNSINQDKIHHDGDDFHELLNDVEKALAQPEQEPVIDKSAAIRIATTLGWTPPRPWVGLTDEEIDELHGSPMNLEHSGALKWVRIIEAKLKEKNT